MSVMNISVFPFGRSDGYCPWSSLSASKRPSMGVVLFVENIIGAARASSRGVIVGSLSVDVGCVLIG